MLLQVLFLRNCVWMKVFIDFGKKSSVELSLGLSFICFCCRNGRSFSRVFDKVLNHVLNELYLHLRLILLVLGFHGVDCRLIRFICLSCRLIYLTFLNLFYLILQFQVTLLRFEEPRFYHVAILRKLPDIGNHFREVPLRYFEFLQPVRAFGQAFKEYVAKPGVDPSKQNLLVLRAYCALDRLCRCIDCFKVKRICLLSFWLTCLL